QRLDRLGWNRRRSRPIGNDRDARARCRVARASRLTRCPPPAISSGGHREHAVPAPAPPQRFLARTPSRLAAAPPCGCPPGPPPFPARRPLSPPQPLAPPRPLSPPTSAGPHLTARLFDPPHSFAPALPAAVHR